MTILVTGATGNVGRDLVDILVQRGHPVRALTRDPARADLPAAVEVVRGSTSEAAAMTSALRGVDAVFLNPVGDVGPVVDALRTATARRVVLVSSVTAGTRDDLVHAQEFRATEERLRAVRADLVALRPGQFMSNTFWWQPMLRAGRVEVPFADVALPAIDPADIAAVAAVALHRDDLAGRDLPLTGRESTSPRERVAVLAQVLDRPLAFHEVSEAEFRAAQSRLPTDVLEYVLAVTGSPNAAELAVSPVVAELTGRAPHTFREWATRHRDALG